MSHTHVFVSGVILLALLPAPIQAQDREGGFHVDFDVGVAVMDFADDADAILGEPAHRVGGAYGLRVGYARGPIDVQAGVELSAVPLRGDHAMSGLAMPFEVAYRPPFAVGPVYPSLVAGYVRYGVGGADVEDDQIPPEIYEANPEERVGFLGNALRVGASFEAPVLRPGLTLHAKPLLDLIWFDTMSVEDEGDVSLPSQSASKRWSLMIGLGYSF